MIFKVATFPRTLRMIGNIKLSYEKKGENLDFLYVVFSFFFQK